MVHFRTEILAPASAAETFEYLSRFSNASEWDPGVRAGEMLTDEPIRLGSRFLLLTGFATRTVRLEYEIIDFAPPTRIVLRAENSFLRSTDTIAVNTLGSGALVVYDSLLEPIRPCRIADPLLGWWFARLGNRAAGGLRRVLNAVEHP